jgi:hypothetical protein
MGIATAWGAAGTTSGIRPVGGIDASAESETQGPDPTGTPFPWVRLVAMVGVVLAAVVLLEWAYSAAPIPPGVDPGDWITRSGAYVGLPVPPFASFGSPYIYPPLIFPLLGTLLLVFGTPITTGFVAGGLLLLMFGLSIIYVAFRFLKFGPLQLGFVGACMFSGTLLYMLSWGGYPNFFAFVFLNLTFVYLLAFARSGDTISGLLLGVSLTLLYLAHSLTFAVGIITVLVTAVLLLVVLGPRFIWARVKNRGLLAGAGLLVATILLYSLSLRLGNITPPNYLGGNPAALFLDNVGQLFSPLGTAPMFFPAGPPVYLTVPAMLALVSSVAVVLVVAHCLLFRFRRRWIGPRHTVAVAALVAALALPVAGTLAGVGTDYPRFVYFLPVPVALLVAVTLDTAVVRWLTTSEPATNPPEGTPTLKRRVPSRAALVAGYLSAGIVLVLLFANVAVPTASQNEFIDTGITHTPQFLDAANWLAAYPTPGSVLTLQGSARWTEALTGRGVYDEGDTWLDFEPWQIVNSQSTFWAFNSQYAVTQGTSIVSYSPGSTSVISQSPMYSVFDEGVIFPIVRVLPGAMTVTVTTPNGTVLVGGNSWGTPNVTVNDTTGVGTIVYSTPWVVATIVGALSAAGAATMNVTLLPANGDSLNVLSLGLGSPPGGVSLLHAPATQTVYASGSGFSWLSTGTLAQLPNPVTLNTTGVFTPAPSSMVVSSFPASVTLTSQFGIPGGDRPFTVSIALSTPGTGNPGVSLPLVLSTEAFLQSRDIHFLLLGSGDLFEPTIAFFEAAFGYTTVYINSGWEVLEGG